MNPLKRMMIADLVPSWPVETVDASNSVADALKKMTEANVTSLVVYQAGKPIGFVDTLDLVAYLCEVCHEGTELPSSVLTVDFNKLIKRSSEFSMAQVMFIINQSHRNPFVLRDCKEPLENAVMDFRHGIHRIAVTRNGALYGVLSQSDFIRWAVKYQVDLNIPNPTIDKSGLESPSKFPMLTCQVIDFVKTVPPVHGVSRQDVVFCSPNSNLIEVMEKSIQHYVHRVFVCDEYRRPIGVVSMTDMIREITIDMQPETIEGK